MLKYVIRGLSQLYLRPNHRNRLTWLFFRRGKSYSIFETKKLFIFAVTLFEIGAVISGAAPNMNTVVVGRAICGAGGEGLYIGSMNIISAFTSPRERPLYFSFFGITWGAGTVYAASIIHLKAEANMNPRLGPVIGGLFTQSSAGWRWAFYLNNIAGAIFIPVYIFLLPTRRPVPADTSSSWALVKRLDCIGFVLFAGTFVSLSMAISFGGVKYEWNSGQVIGLFCCFIALVSLLSLQQSRAIFTTPRDRLLPIQSFQEGDEMFILIIETATSTAILFIGLNYVSIFLQFVRSETALSAAVALLPLIFTAVVVMLITGFLLDKLGYYSFWYLGGSLLAVVGTGLMYSLDSASSLACVYGYPVLFGSGVSLYMQASYTLAQTRLHTNEASDAVAIIACTQFSGTSIFLTVADSILLNRAANEIQYILPDVPRDAVQAAIAGGGAQIFRDLPTATKKQVLDRVSDAIRDVWALSLALALLSFVAATFMRREKRPTRKRLTDMN